MSEFSVCRTAGGGLCLILDDTRIAGAKPEFSSDNCVWWWVTKETYGPVDDYVTEIEKVRAMNARLWKAVRDLRGCFYPTCLECPAFPDGCATARHVLETDS